MYVEHYEKLGAEHRDAVIEHLTSLDKHSRTLRFGTSARDEAVTDYVTTIDFERDIVEGVWDNKTLVGVAHLAVYKDRGGAVGELGISVSEEARHRHIGKRLLSRVLVHARLLQLTNVYVHFITRNRSMARLAREFTDMVEVDRGDATATISLDAITQAAA
jgi:N-acetylglutamate synthase-like GNAT family acetyltransferase